MRSLRFRLPALFLGGMLVAALVTAVLTVRFFQEYARDRAFDELSQQAAGLADLYAQQAIARLDQGSDAPRFAAPLLERSTGSRLYYSGVGIFPGQISGLRPLDRKALDWKALRAGSVQTLEFEPPGSDRVYLAAAHPITLGGETFGALVVAKPREELRQRWLGLVERVGIAFLAGLAVALGLVWYLSRRLTEPVLALSRAADEVAERRYGAELPEPSTSGDEIAQLTERFREMTERLAEAEAHERNFLVRVSHELRTPLTAVRGHVDALREGLADDPDAREASLAVIRAETDRLARLVGDLVDLAKLDANRFTLEEHEVELRLLLEHAHQSFAEEARRREIDFDIHLGADPVLRTDGDRVLQIVSNLLDNAFDWTPDGGRITLELEATNGTVAVAVTDTGPGRRPRGARADLPPVRDARRRPGNGARARHLAGARARARRGARPRLRAGKGLSLRASAAGDGGRTLRARPGLGSALDRVERASGPLLEAALDPVRHPLEPVEAALHSLPTGGDQVDEQGEVFDPLPPLGADLGGQGVDAADGAGGEAAQLGDVPGHGQHLGAHAFLDGRSQPIGNCRLELGRSLRERVEPGLRALERRREVGVGGAALVSLRDAPAGAPESLTVHARRLYSWRRTGHDLAVSGAHRRARLRPAARADRPATARAPRRRAAARVSTERAGEVGPPPLS